MAARTSAKAVRELEADRDAVVVNGVARNKALKLYNDLVGKGTQPRQAFDRAIRDYLVSTSPSSTPTKVAKAKRGETPYRYAERLGIPEERQPRAIFNIEEALFYYGLTIKEQDAWNAFVVREAIAFDESKCDPREYVQCHHNWRPKLRIREWLERRSVSSIAGTSR